MKSKVGKPSNTAADLQILQVLPLGENLSLICRVSKNSRGE